MFFSKCLFAIGLWLVTICLHAQPSFSPFSISRLTPSEGLSQGSNYFRYEDSRGFMWLTGNDALNRYDGRTVKVYNLNRYFKNYEILQQGYGFAEDTFGNLYVGSTRGLYIYHRRQDLFTLQKVFSLSGDSTAMPFAYRNGKIWCYNRHYQIATYEVATKTVQRITQLPIDPLVSVHIYSLTSNTFYYRLPFIDNNGILWAVGRKAIAGFNTVTQRHIAPFAQYLRRHPYQFYASCYQGGRLICGTNNGLLLLDLPSGTAKPITHLQQKKLGIVLALACTDSMLVFKSSETGLHLLGTNHQKIQPQSNGLPVDANIAFHFSFDKGGRLWMCEDGVGLVIIAFRQTVSGLGRALPLQALGGSCHTFAELPDGNILVKHQLVQDRISQQLRTWHLSIAPTVNGNSLRTVTDRFRNGIWFFEEGPTGPDGQRPFCFYGPQGLKRYRFNTRAIAPNSQQKDMVVLPDGRLLCTFEEGLFWLWPTTGSIEPVAGAMGRNAFTISLLSGNRVAVSYLHSDMQLYELRPNNTCRLLNRILPGTQTFYLQQDTVRQCYWAGTNQGVYRLNARWQVLQHFDANNGLAGTYIYGLLLDGAGNAFCSHQRGMSQLNAQNGQIVNLGPQDGIQDWDFHNRAFFKASDGTLFFGGAKGFNWIRPPLQLPSYYQTEVYVDEILVNNRPAMPDSNANYINRLSLGHQQNNLSVKAVVKDLANGALYQLMYRIAETDTDWKLLPNGNTINFNQLAPGTYTLQLGIYNKYGLQKKAGRSLSILIAAPFYRKAWFWALMAIAATATVLWWIYRNKLAGERDKFQQQLALEKQRQRITADLHDDIGATLSSLQINSAIASSMVTQSPQQAQTILHKIETQAQSLAHTIGDIVWSMKPGEEEFMTLGTRIKKFAGEILEPVNIQFTIAIPPAIDKGLSDMALRKNLLLILKEAINNAAKYSRATTMHIGLQMDAGHIELAVTDNGTGFDIEQAKGNGLGNMQHRAHELGGQLWVASTPGKGTTVRASIPFVP
jgi:signal transduction histidine kinase/ligand-binding sensor domain-containing protein